MFALVAQLDRAPVFGTVGWGFKSLQGHIGTIHCMSEAPKFTEQFSGTVSESHFASYLNAGLQMPVSHFGLNLAHLRAITTYQDPAAYFGEFFVSTLTPQRLLEVGNAMNRAHRSADVAIFSDASHVAKLEVAPRIVGPEAFQEEWQISKAHTIRSLLSYIHGIPVPLPDKPTDLITDENGKLIYDFLRNPDHVGMVNDIAFMASRARNILETDPQTLALKKRYVKSLRGDSTEPKRRVKRQIATKLRQEFPDADIQWLFKETFDDV